MHSSSARWCCNGVIDRWRCVREYSNEELTAGSSWNYHGAARERYSWDERQLS